MKRLMLDRQNKKIAGVCAGIANYFEVDVTVIRILFLVGLICCSFGFWVYLIVWLVAPSSDKYIEKL